MSMTFLPRFIGIAAILSTILTVIDSQICDVPPIDLNTADLTTLQRLPYISSSGARIILGFQPNICSPMELANASSPKKVSGITEYRVNHNWKWEANQACSVTCCLADASCSNSSTAPLAPQSSYRWNIGEWSVCLVACGGGTQERSVSCSSGSSSGLIVNSAYCLNVNGTQPLNKRVCNTQSCPNYQWQATEWSECVASADDNDEQCVRTRTVDCYDLEVGELVKCADCCDGDDILPTTLTCEDWQCFGDSEDTNEVITADDIHIKIDLQRTLNQQRCHTDMFDARAEFDYNNTFIVRRGCAVSSFVAVTGIPADAVVDVSWFKIQAELQALENEEVGDEWSSQFLSWTAIDAHSGYLTLSLPSTAAVGEYWCHLFYNHADKVELQKEVLAEIRLFVLFNPYDSATDEYVASLVDRKECVENEQGLVWKGSAQNYFAEQWAFGQFHFPNLQVAMYLLRRLAYAHRSDLVLVSRQISFAIGRDICYGRWSEPYTSGRPSGGYYCSQSSGRICNDPGTWTSTTQVFDLFRDVLDYRYSVQYCQCFVYAAVSTTVGRALGIATRPVTNYESAHDTDYNRAIDTYFLNNDGWYDPTDGPSHDSVWNFHVWNEMFFKRRYDWSDEGVSDWNAVDATPQEMSYGGNPALGSAGEYQMGPAQLSMVKSNNNTDACAQSLAAAGETGDERFGCFDQEFVISEVNSQFNMWLKLGNAAADEPFKLKQSSDTDPWNPTYTIGQLMSTKKPGGISATCANQMSNSCDAERLDVTYFYKHWEPSGPGIPTDKSNYVVPERRWRRRLLDADEKGVEYSIVTEPTEDYFARTIVAEDIDSMLSIYHQDDTYGLVSLEIDSFFDDSIVVYCSFAVTAHAYNGDKLKMADNSTVIKTEKYQFELQGGYSGACVFNLTYADYQHLMQEETFNPYAFKFSVVASVYDSNNVTQDAYQVIVEQLDFLVCIPKYKFADRIVCQNGLKWYEPSYNVSFACDGIDGVDLESVADGFCDVANNVAPCFDGGDCCASSCVYGSVFSCAKEAFDCIDDRVHSANMQNSNCTDPIAFVQYVEQLWSSSICVDVQTSITDQLFVCTEGVGIINGTGNACVDRIVSVHGKYGSLGNCALDTKYALSEDVQNVIRVVDQCLATINEDGSDTGAGIGSAKQIWIVVVVLAAVLVAVAIIVVGIIYVRKRRQSTLDANGTYGTYLAMTSQPAE